MTSIRLGSADRTETAALGKSALLVLVMASSLAGVTACSPGGVTNADSSPGIDAKPASGGANGSGGRSDGGTDVPGDSGVTSCVAGGSCPSPGGTCTDASGATCRCVGPTGAAYLTCDPVGGSGGGVNGSGGGPGSGGIGAGGQPGTGGRGGSGGSGTGGNGGGGTGSGGQGVLCGGTAPWTTAATVDYTLAVDAAQKGAAWNRFYEKGVASCHADTVLNTAWGRNIQGALKKGHDQAGFQYIRFHGILDGDINVYTEVNGTPVYNWTSFDAVYDAIKAAGMRPVVEISFMPPALASGTSTLHWYGGAAANITPPKDWNKWMEFMAAIVTHLEGRYGADEVRNNWFFEVWNESSWMYSLGMGGYNELFGYTVRGLYKGDPLVKVGGPAESAGGSSYGISSLINYCKSNSLKLDFVSYHVYGEDSSGVAKVAPTVAMQSTIMNTVKSSGFTGLVFDTEWGGTYSATTSRDTEVSASFIAKTIHLLGTSATVAPPWMYAYWTISDLYEEFNTGTNTAYREGNYGLLLKGDSRYPESWDVAKPAFNAFRILHMMGDARLAATGGTASDGVGVAATVSSTGDALQILVYNHVDGGAASPTGTKMVKLTVNNLPFTGTPHVRHYVLDHTRSNSYYAWTNMGKPAQPSQAQWTTLRNAAELCYYETTAPVSGGAWTVTFPQNTYGVSLIVITP